MALLNKVIALVGPTGSGKTDISIQLAQHYNAVIINLDSIQIYKELNIGSAKPSKEDLDKVPHYLVNIASINEPKNSFFIFQESYHLIQALKNSYNIILTGGTGLYYKNLLYGMFETPSFSRDYREKIRLKTTAELYEELTLSDIKSAMHIHPNDRVRIERALEVKHSTGESIIDLRQQQNYIPPADFLLCGITYPRDILYERINHRVIEMIHNGLLAEVDNIIKSSEDIPPILYRTIGYKEILPYLEGKETLNQCVAEIQQNTRRYAKRQLTLFRNMKDIHWFNQEQTVEEIIHYIDANTLSFDSSI